MNVPSPARAVGVLVALAVVAAEPSLDAQEAPTSLAASVAPSEYLPPEPPSPELAVGEVLSDNGEEWMFWASLDGPRTWPISAPPAASQPLSMIVPEAVVQTPDRIIPMMETPGYTVPPAGWISGTRAPYAAESSLTWLEQEPRRMAQEERRIRRGRDLPSQTRFVYPTGVEPTYDETGAITLPSYDEYNPEPGVANLYFVRTFRVDDPRRFVALQMEVEFAAGAIVYVNGHEVARHHVPPGGEAHGRPGDPYWLADHVNQTMYRRWQMTWLDVNPAVLRAGENTIAVAVYKRPTGGRRAFYFDLRLEGHEEAAFLKTPYLQRVEQGRITAMWETNVSGYAYVRFGVAPDAMDREATSAQIASGHHEVVLDGLEPGTRYYYQARTVTASGEVIESDVRTFHTAVPRGTDFSFVAYGDNRSTPEVHTPLIQQMWTDAVAADAGFVLSTGDLVTNASPWREWQDEFFRPALPLMGHFAYYTSLGNHEGNHESYYHYLDLPGNESWYTFSYGDADFFAVNSSAAYTPGSPQHTWLSDALAASDAPWKIVFFHHPPYACTPARKPGDIGIQENVVPLLEQHGVQLALLGHDHLYGRSVELNGVTYVITGGGGAPQYPSEPDEINEICRTEYHYCMVEVSGDRLELRAIALGGEEIDRVLLTR